MKFKDYLVEADKLQPKLKQEIDRILRAGIGRKNYTWQAGRIVGTWYIKFSTAAQASMAHDKLINDEFPIEINITVNDDVLTFGE